MILYTIKYAIVYQKASFVLNNLIYVILSKSYIYDVHFAINISKIEVSYLKNIRP